jgi:hypothetical protein
MACKPPGYYTECSEARSLTKRFGDYFEALTADEKLGLIAVLSLYLRDECRETIPNLCDLFTHDGKFVLSTGDRFYKILELLEEIKPYDALNLIAALIEQLRSGVFAE